MSDATTPAEPAPNDVRAAVEAIIESDALAGSGRLQGFLRYVVDEALNGRGHLIRAKTIALDLYVYSVDEVARRENVVRVDAGRLRRRLEDYYAEEGLDAPIVVSLPKGGYAPQFRISVQAAASEASLTLPKALAASRPWIWAALAGGACAVGVALFLVSDRSGEQPKISDQGQPGLEREAIFETSPHRLQAVNLAEDGRDLIFPAVDPNRLNAALMIFESAIALDDSYFGGFAGVAQVQATLAILTDDATAALQFVEAAISASDRALALAPSAAWSQSARAWAEFARGENSSALNYSKRAVSLDPHDLHIVEFDALISLYTGSFDRLFAVAERAIDSKPSNQGFVFQNALGSARYHSGDFAGTIAAFERAIADGAPTGPVVIAYLMAAHHMLGHDQEARALAEQYMESWPDQRIDLLFQRLFADKAYGVELATGMRGAGWTPRSQ